MQSDTSGTPPSEIIAAQDKLHQTVPEGILLEKDGGSLRICYSQFKLIYWVTLAFGLLFACLSIYLLATGGVVVVVGTSLLLGLFMVYSALVGIINKRTIEVNHSQLKFTYGPLPLEKNHFLESSQLSQLYTHKMATTARFGDITGFTLEAILRDGSLVPLLSDPSYDKVHFLEMEIETWLGIKDLQIEGEVVLTPKPLR
jgi:hypothetical protein